MFKVDGLPEGWNVLAFRKPKTGEHYFSPALDICQAKHDYLMAHLIVEKIQPRRIVLEDTDEERSLSYGDWYEDDEGNLHKYLNESFGSRRTYKVWREVKETEIPLKMGESHGDAEETTLSLTKKDMLDLIEHLKLGGQLNPKIAEFIKDK